MIIVCHNQRKRKPLRKSRERSTTSKREQKQLCGKGNPSWALKARCVVQGPEERGPRRWGYPQGSLFREGGNVQFQGSKRQKSHEVRWKTRLLVQILKDPNWLAKKFRFCWMGLEGFPNPPKSGCRVSH